MRKADGRIKRRRFKTACSAACETGAIQFGDINDEHSAVSTLKKTIESYHLLEAVGTKPNVFYQPSEKYKRSIKLKKFNYRYGVALRSTY